MYEENDQVDIIEGVDEDGNKLLLQVMDYFFYNGDQYVLLSEADEDCGCDEECECDCEAECEADSHEMNLYIMKVVEKKDENGEEIEEFIPVDEDLMDTLIEVVQTNFNEEVDDEEIAPEEE